MPFPQLGKNTCFHQHVQCKSAFALTILVLVWHKWVKAWKQFSLCPVYRRTNGARRGRTNPPEALRPFRSNMSNAGGATHQREMA